MREYRATVGETDGSIIAAIMTIQTPRNQPRVPRSVPGPSSMPRMRSTVHHQPAAASANSSAISTSRLRAAAKAGRSPLPSPAWCAEATITSSGPREQRCGQGGLALVLNAEPIDLRPLRLGYAEFRACRMEHPHDSHGLACLDAGRHNVLDLEIDRVADPHTVAQAVLLDFDRRTLDAQILTD